MNKVKILSVIFGMTLMMMTSVPSIGFQFANAQVTGGETVISFNSDQTVSSTKFIGLGNTANNPGQVLIVAPTAGAVDTMKCSLNAANTGTYTFTLFVRSGTAPGTLFLTTGLSNFTCFPFVFLLISLICFSFGIRVEAEASTHYSIL